MALYTNGHWCVEFEIRRPDCVVAKNQLQANEGKETKYMPQRERE
jgi:hypothetical protein